MSKWLKKLLSIILTIITVISSCSVMMSVFAEELSINDTEFIETAEPEYQKEPEIVSEVEEERTEYSKTYLMSNGSFEIYMYGTPIHVQDENGSWVEIQNSSSTRRRARSTSNAETSLDATYVSMSSVNSNYNSADYIKVSSSETGLVKINSLPGLAECDHIVSARLNLPIESATIGATVYAYKITGDWSNNSVTYANIPNISENVLDYSDCNGNISIDVTKMFNDDSFYGVALKSDTDVRIAKGTNEPILKYSYIDTTGINDNFKYAQYNIGSDEVCINMQNGNLVINQKDVSIGEYNISSIYNSIIASEGASNWNFNFDNDDTNTFNKVEVDSATTDITDADGNKVRIVTSNTAKTLTHIFSDGSIGDVEVLSYNENGDITQVELNNIVQVTYEYDNNNRITSVKDKDNYGITLTYEGATSRVSTVTESKGTSVRERISYVRTVDSCTETKAGNDLEFGTSDDLITEYAFNSSCQLVSSRTHTHDGEYLDSVSYEYSPVNNELTTVSPAGKISSNYLKSHNIESMTDWSAKKLDDTGCQYSTSYVTNESYVGNGSIKVVASDFTQNGVCGAYQTLNVSEGVLEPGETYVLSAYIKTDGIVRDTDADSIRSSGAAVMARVFSESETTPPRTYSEMVTNTEGDWERVFMSFPTPNDLTKIEIYLVIRNGKGTAYFDAAQLEKGMIPSQYNMIENNSFDYSTNWVRYNNLTSSDKIENGLMKFVGNPTENKLVYQDINLDDANQSDTYILQAIAQADSVSLRGSRRFDVHANVYYRDENGTSSSITKAVTKFNTFNTSTQYSQIGFDLSEKTPLKKPYKIRIIVSYYYNANDAQFDCVSLFKSSDVFDLNGGKKYTFNDDGTVKSYTDNLWNVTKYWYNDNKKMTSTETKDVDGVVTYSATYNDDGNILTEYDNGEVTRNTYNTDGILVSTRTEDDEQNVIRSATYNNDGDILTKYDNGETTVYTYSANKVLISVETKDKNQNVIYSAAYNSNGDILTEYDDEKTTTYTYDDNNVILSAQTVDNKNTVVYSATYVDGNIATMVEDGVTTTYTYYSDGNLASETSAGKTTAYTYDANGKVATKAVSEGSKTLIYSYSDDKLTSVTHNGFDYNYTYNTWGDAASVKVGNQNLISYSYLNNGALSKKTYGNGSVESYTYNEYGQLLNKKQTGIGTYALHYDSKGILVYERDNVNNQRTYYKYDEQGRNVGEHVVSTVNSNAYNNELYKTRLTYDDDGNINYQSITANGNTISTPFSYNDDGLLETAQLTGTRAVTYSYDDDQRLTSRSLSTNTPVTEEFTYNEDESIKTHKIGNDTYSYTYNDEGNITEIKKNDVLRQSYVYDSENQLIRENNLDTNKTVTYTYDNGGNVSEKKEYAYTLGEVGTANNTISYTYDTTWKDLLTNFNGQTISYDQIGNPTTYRGATTTWFGRQMQSYSKGSTDITYSYDSDGLRTKKIVNGIEYDYYYVDGQLMYEKKGNEYELFYRYDTDGRLCLVVKNRISDNYKWYYYVITNTQGDVIEIHNGAGAVTAKYNYDSWGKLLSITDASGTPLGASSFAYQISVRYRGYVYDSETGLYYLQSRYYDPETGRFINCDSPDFIGISESFTSWNGFAYCENNWVNDMDPSGEVAISVILGTILGMVFGAMGFFLDIIIKDLTLIQNAEKFKNKVRDVLSNWQGKGKLFLKVIMGGIDGAFSTTNKYQLYKNIYNVIKTCTNIALDGLDVLSLVIECVLSYICSKMLPTEQIFSKFNSSKIQGKAKNLACNFKNINDKKIKAFIKVIKNQIIYYIKSNSKAYDRFIKNFALSSVSSWLSKLPELSKNIQSLIKAKAR